MSLQPFFPIWTAHDLAAQRAQSAFGAIAHHGIADALGDGKAKPWRLQSIFRRKGLQNKTFIVRSTSSTVQA